MIETFWKILVSLLLLSTTCADIAENIYSTAENSKQIFLDFTNDSIKTALQNIYCDANETVSDNYAVKLNAVLQKQMELRKQMEYYEANDWQKKFGDTGLWDKSKTDMANTALRIEQITEPVKSDFQIIAEDAMLQLKKHNAESLQQLFEKYPFCREMIANLILKKISTLRYDLSDITLLEVDLAVQAVWQNWQQYKEMINKLVQIKKFQNQQILFLAAKVAEHHQQPLKAFGLFTEAANGKNLDIAITAQKNAAAIACENWQLFEPDKALNAVEKYIQNSKDGYGRKCYRQMLENYCKVLLKNGTAEGAQKVLAMCGDKNLPVIRARAWWILGHKDKTANQIASANDFDNDAEFCSYVLNDVMLSIEEYVDLYGEPFLNDCIKIAERTGNDRNAIELNILNADSNNIEKLRKKIAKMENSLTLTALLATKAEDWQNAHELWSQVLCQILTNKQYWRAKYYQLDTLAKLGDENRQKAAHAAEVLVASENPPQFYRKKLHNLFEQGR